MELVPLLCANDRFHDYSISDILKSINEHNMELVPLLCANDRFHDYSISDILKSINEHNMELVPLLCADEKIEDLYISEILSLVNEHNKPILEQLLQKKKFTGFTIKSILKLINDVNEEFIPQLCANEKIDDFHIREILSLVNEHNKPILEQLLQKKKFTGFIIKSILESINDVNEEFIPQLLTTRRFKSYHISSILKAVNEHNRELVPEILANKKIKSYLISCILEATNNENLELAKQLLADIRVPNTLIESILKENNPQFRNQKLNFVLKLSNDNINEQDIFRIVEKINETNFGLVEQLSADEKFPIHALSEILAVKDAQIRTEKIELAKHLYINEKIPSDAIGIILQESDVNAQNNLIEIAKKLLADENFDNAAIKNALIGERDIVSFVRGKKKIKVVYDKNSGNVETLDKKKGIYSLSNGDNYNFYFDSRNRLHMKRNTTRGNVKNIGSSNIKDTKIDWQVSHTNDDGSFYRVAYTYPDGSQRVVSQISAPPILEKNPDGSIKRVVEKSKVLVRTETQIQYTSDGNITTQTINGKTTKFQSSIKNDVIFVRNLETGEVITQKLAEFINFNEHSYQKVQHHMKKNDVIKSIRNLPSGQLHNLLQQRTKMNFHKEYALNNAFFVPQANTIDTLPYSYTTLHEIGHSYFSKIRRDKTLQDFWTQEYNQAKPMQKLHTDYFGIHSKHLFSTDIDDGLNEICAELNAIINASDTNDEFSKRLGIRMQQLMEVYPKTCQRIIELLYGGEVPDNQIAVTKSLDNTAVGLLPSQNNVMHTTPIAKAVQSQEISEYAGKTVDEMMLMFMEKHTGLDYDDMSLLNQVIKENNRDVAETQFAWLEQKLAETPKEVFKELLRLVRNIADNNDIAKMQLAFVDEMLANNSFNYGKAFGLLIHTVKKQDVAKIQIGLAKKLHEIAPRLDAASYGGIICVSKYVLESSVLKQPYSFTDKDIFDIVSHKDSIFASLRSSSSSNGFNKIPVISDIVSRFTVSVDEMESEFIAKYPKAKDSFFLENLRTEKPYMVKSKLQLADMILRKNPDIGFETLHNILSVLKFDNIHYERQLSVANDTLSLMEPSKINIGLICNMISPNNLAESENFLAKINLNPDLKKLFAKIIYNKPIHKAFSIAELSGSNMPFFRTVFNHLEKFPEDIGYAQELVDKGLPISSKLITAMKENPNYKVVLEFFKNLDIDNISEKTLSIVIEKFKNDTTLVDRIDYCLNNGLRSNDDTFISNNDIILAIVTKITPNMDYKKGIELANKYGVDDPVEIFALISTMKNNFDPEPILQKYQAKGIKKHLSFIPSLVQNFGSNVEKICDMLIDTGFDQNELINTVGYLLSEPQKIPTLKKIIDKGFLKNTYHANSFFMLEKWDLLDALLDTPISDLKTIESIVGLSVGLGQMKLPDGYLEIYTELGNLLMDRQITRENFMFISKNPEIKAKQFEILKEVKDINKSLDTDTEKISPFKLIRHLATLSTDKLSPDVKSEFEKAIEFIDDLYKNMTSRKDILKSGTVDLSDTDIRAFIYDNSQELMLIQKLIGKSALLDAFNLKLEGLENLCKSFDDLWATTTDAQKQSILEIFNTPESAKGQRIQQIIQALRRKNSDLAKIPDLAIKKAPMKIMSDRIKALKTKVTTMQNTIKGMSTKEKISKLNAMSAIVQRNPDDFDMFLNIIKSGDNSAWSTAINKKIFDVIGIPYDEAVSAKLGLQNSDYLAEILSANEPFKEYFKVLVEVIAQNQDLSVSQALETLEQNIQTRKAFEERGLNYDRWINADKNSFEPVVVTLNAQKARQATITALEADLNDVAFKLIPTEETQKIVDALKEKDIELIEKEEVVYDADGFNVGTKKSLRLFFEGKPIEFNKMETAIRIIKNTMNDEPFWSRVHENLEINEARKTVYEHITKLRDNEVSLASRLSGEKTTNLEIRQTDMTDISHSLFLGNHGACCTAVGANGGNQFSAPTYIKNRLISAIEIVDGKNFIGNTMCYIAEVDGETALVLDNIEVGAKYQGNDTIRDAFMKYAKKFVAELGKPDMPIYAGPLRHKFDMKVYPIQERNVKILGSTGIDEIYIDYIGPYTVDGKTELVNFYKIQ